MRHASLGGSHTGTAADLQALTCDYPAKRPDGKPPGLSDDVRLRDLQRRASNRTRKARCGTLKCCMILSLNRFRFEESYSG
ncbi:hypothetical protein FKV68_03975 [Sinorhizobium mexicanum]|uniref:Uncharacterized protein n=1 Tax=Sinorhizobium mexicanum TaxID=375549 RepID=A0A859QFB6_9HYPH|nr:hypothetical protein FKV68_03975 [Sinorhizobium mexicanum]